MRNEGVLVAHCVVQDGSQVVGTSVENKPCKWVRGPLKAAGVMQHCISAREADSQWRDVDLVCNSHGKGSQGGTIS